MTDVDDDTIAEANQEDDVAFPTNGEVQDAIAELIMILDAEEEANRPDAGVREIQRKKDNLALLIESFDYTRTYDPPIDHVANACAAATYFWRYENFRYNSAWGKFSTWERINILRHEHERCRETEEAEETFQWLLLLRREENDRLVCELGCKMGDERPFTPIETTMNDDDVSMTRRRKKKDKRKRDVLREADA